MFDTQKNLHTRGILDVLKILSSNGESGRLEMQAGTAEGFFFLKNGQLVDARVGHLTGFPAVNAVASMRDARFSFDPTAVPPTVSSITASERVVLRQFFGIDTADPSDIRETPQYSDEEVTIETSRIPVEAIPVEAIPAPVAQVASSKSFSRGGLVVVAVLLFILVGVAAVALRNKYRERVLGASVATTEQPVSPAAAEVVKTNEAAPVAVAQPATAPRVEPANPQRVKAPAEQRVESVIAQDLTGKWNVVNTVQKTSYRGFHNLKIGFDLSINQNGNSISGTGQKVSENGRSLPAGYRTPIQVKGSINGDRVEATFFEEGSLRKTSGRFVWHINKDGALSGTFVSTAAGASGKSAAKKEL